MANTGRGQGSALLEALRRLAGGWLTQAAVREMPLSRLGRAPSMARLALGGLQAEPGSLEESLRSPSVPVRPMAKPVVNVAGGTNRPGAAESLFGGRVGADAAKFSLAEPARVSGCLVSPPEVGVPLLVAQARERARVLEEPTAPHGGAVPAAIPLISSGRLGVSRLTLVRPRLSASAAGGARPRSSGVPAIARPRCLPVPAALAERIPMDRARLAMPPLGSLERQAAFLKERQLLAQAAGEGGSFTEVDLIGIYRKVPIGAARRLEVEKGTEALLLYLRPQILGYKAAGEKQVVTIVIGKVKSDGRLVRAIVKESGG